MQSKRYTFYYKLQKKLEFIQKERERETIPVLFFGVFFQIFLVTFHIHQNPSFIRKVKDVSSQVLFASVIFPRLPRGKL